MKRLQDFEQIRFFQDSEGKPSMGRYLAWTAARWGKVVLVFGIAAGGWALYSNQADFVTLSVSAMTAGGVLLAGSEFAKSWQAQAGK